MTGDATGTPTQFDGLENWISTNITDDANDALGYRNELLENEIVTIMNSYGVRPTAVVTSFGMKKAINESLGGDVRVNLDQTNSVATGLDVNFFQSMIGKLPIMATFAVATDTATYVGNTVSDIYVLTQATKGQDVI